jgi:hypothetical protein
LSSKYRVKAAGKCPPGGPCQVDLRSRRECPVFLCRALNAEHRSYGRHREDDDEDRNEQPFHRPMKTDNSYVAGLVSLPSSNWAPRRHRPMVLKIGNR